MRRHRERYLAVVLMVSLSCVFPAEGTAPGPASASAEGTAPGAASASAEGTAPGPASASAEGTAPGPASASAEGGASGAASALAGGTAERNIRFYEKEAASPDHVTLSFAGDISFAEDSVPMSRYRSAGNEIARCISPDVISRMDSADIMMINNEFTYSDRGRPLPGKTYTFRARPETAANLEKLSVDIVSVANNHVYDYGETALIDTLDTLDACGMPYVGAGRNLEEAKGIVCFRINGMTIAYVSATQVERSYVFTKEATETSAGVLRTYDPSRFLEVIRRAEEVSDFVAVYVHWGTEGVSRFEEDQQSLGHQYIDAGADLVIGNHTHCLQGVEYYKGVPIFYSLGNFWFNSKTRDTCLVEVDITREGVKELRFVPCLQKDCQTLPVTDENNRLQKYAYLTGISSGAFVDENGVIHSVSDTPGTEGGTAEQGK